jgi:hypothetical protein
LPIRIYELKMKGFKKQLGGFVGNVMELNIWIVNNYSWFFKKINYLKRVKNFSKKFSKKYQKKFKSLLGCITSQNFSKLLHSRAFSLLIRGSIPIRLFNLHFQACFSFLHLRAHNFNIPKSWR